jgi:hypothetical protein
MAIHVTDLLMLDSALTYTIYTNNMNNKGIRYLISFIMLLLLTSSLVVACAQLNPSPPPTPSQPPPTSPPTTSENQTPEEALPINETGNEEKWYPIGNFNSKGNYSTPTFRVYGTQLRITWTIETEYPESSALDLIIYFSPSGSIWKTTTFKGDSSGDIIFFVGPGDNRDLFINVMARNLLNWTISLEDNAPAIITSPVLINSVYYKGTVSQPEQEGGCCTYEKVEPDEYVVIKNLSEEYQDISGWVLKNISRPTIPYFTFPRFMPVLLAPGEIIRVYTDEYHSETGGFSFNYGTGDIWRNDKPDIAVLYDAQGYEISRKSYAVPTNNE